MTESTGTTSQIPAWADYIVSLWGSQDYADYIASSVDVVGGRALMLGDGRVALDDNAVRWLRRQPEDADGCIDDDMQLWMEGGCTPVTAV
jgi:hypothetical protein